MTFRANPRQALFLWWLVVSGEEPQWGKAPLVKASDKRRLVDEGLILREIRTNPATKRRAGWIILTDAAWDWATTNMLASLAPSQTLGSKTAAGLLKCLEQYIASNNVSLADVLRAARHPPGPDGLSDLRSRIRTAYLEASQGRIADACQACGPATTAS